MTSYWERESLLNYDYIVIGGGIVGLSTAVSIKESNRDASVLIMEREVIPTGASTKNAGFACIGSLTEILDDLNIMSEADVVNLVKTRRMGLQLLRDRLGDDNIGYKENGSYELIADNQMWAIQHIDKINNLLRPILGGDAFTLCDTSLLDQFQFNKSYVKHLVKNNYEGEIHTGKMMNRFTNYAIQLGVHTKNVNVLDFIDIDINNNKNNNQQSSSPYKVIVKVENKVLCQEIEFKCKKLAICTNAFTKELIKDIDVIPGRGQVLVTEKIIGGIPFNGTFHYDEGYYYFREIDGRVLFGGGRNLDFEAEKCTDFKRNDRIYENLERILRDMILPNHKDIAIQHSWSGIMAFGKDKKPIIEFHSPNVVLGVRMGGMGVAIGSLVGKSLSSMILNHQSSSPIFIKSLL